MVITLLIGVITPLLTGRGPPCIGIIISQFDCLYVFFRWTFLRIRSHGIAKNHQTTILGEYLLKLFFFCWIPVVHFPRYCNLLFFVVNVFCLVFFDFLSHRQDPKDKVRAGAFGDPWGVAELLNLEDSRPWKKTRRFLGSDHFIGLVGCLGMFRGWNTTRWAPY